MQLDHLRGELTIEYLITRQFSTADEFSIFIEKEAIERGITSFEMVIEYCEERGVDPVAVSGMITERLKDLIRLDAENKNLMKQKYGKLPL